MTEPERLHETVMAHVVTREFFDGAVVNLGVGLPLECANALPEGREILLHSELGLLGFGLTRREGSGKRLWGWAEDRFGTPDRFFDQIYVHNYCPLLFVHEAGRNIVPEKLTRDERDSLFGPCDDALRSLVDVMEPEVVIGVGKFAWRRATEILDGAVPTDCILHPSPASPLANKDWPGQVEPVFRKHGVEV